MLFVRLCCRFLFAIKLFRVRFDLRRLLLYYLGLKQNVPVIVILLSFFFIFLKFSTTLPVQFHSIFIRNSCFLQLVFCEGLGKKLAIYCIALRNEFSSSFDVSGFNCKWLLSFPFAFVP